MVHINSMDSGLVHEAQEQQDDHDRRGLAVDLQSFTSNTASMVMSLRDPWYSWYVFLLYLRSVPANGDVFCEIGWPNHSTE